MPTPPRSPPPPPDSPPPAPLVLSPVHAPMPLLTMLSLASTMIGLAGVIVAIIGLARRRDRPDGRLLIANNDNVADIRPSANGTRIDIDLVSGAGLSFDPEVVDDMADLLADDEGDVVEDLEEEVDELAGEVDELENVIDAIEIDVPEPERIDHSIFWRQRDHRQLDRAEIVAAEIDADLAELREQTGLRFRLRDD